MPPKQRITRDMIIDAAVEVARQQGHENINARTVAAQLHCSTQPVMYHFTTIESLKKAAYAHVDQMHTDYLMRCPEGRDPILSIGLNYVRFACEHPRLFRFLFQSGYTEGDSLTDLLESDALEPILAAMEAGAALDRERTKNVFLTVALFAHGCASLIANNGLRFDETQLADYLARAWNGAVLAAKEESL